METNGLVGRHGNPWVGSLPELLSITEKRRPRDGETEAWGTRRELGASRFLQAGQEPGRDGTGH